MLRHAKRRAANAGVPFQLKETDIVIPKFCPILGIKLGRNVGGFNGSDSSPSLDRVVPANGYIPGNVVVISMRANRIKSDSSVEELQKLAKFYTRLLKQQGKLL